MEQEYIDKILSDIPEHLLGKYSLEYDLLEDVEFNDMPEAIITDIKTVLNTHQDEWTRFRAAYLLCRWGIDEGFDYLVSGIEKNHFYGLIEHRLRNYDDTYQHILNALIGYWAKRIDQSDELGEAARQKIFAPIKSIIALSNQYPFEIRSLFWLVEDEEYHEYIPLLEEHLAKIIDQQQLHYWKVIDVMCLLMRLDKAFVLNLLKQKGISLGNFDLRKGYHPYPD